MGRLCYWTPDPDGPSADEYSSFGAYQRSLTLKCDKGEPGIITWTPDNNTPDTVYYQCFTHRHLGWKINVMDECEETLASELDEVYADPDSDNDEGIDAEPSIRHETKIQPAENYFFSSDRELLKNHNMNGVPPKLNIQLHGSGEMNKLISSGIRAAEELEKQVRATSNLSSLNLDEMNQGEQIPELSQSSVDIKIPNSHNVQANPDSGFPLYVKPGQNGQYLRPAKVPMRRYPSQIVERRPMSNRPPRPFILPQPSMLVNHYKQYSGPPNSGPGNSRPYRKKLNKPIMILGEPEGIKQYSFRPQSYNIDPAEMKNYSPKQYQHHHGDHLEMNNYPSRPHLHHEEPPQETKNYPPRHNEFANKFPLRQPPQSVPFPDHIPNGYMKKPDKPVVYPHHQKPPVQKVIPLKEPENAYSNVHYSESVDQPEGGRQHPTFRPASNTGFKPHSVIVESGFRPIVNRRNEGEEENRSEHQSRNDQQRRRSDIDIISEIDEAIESDALMINSEEPNRSFEPMFIPSPRDDVTAGKNNKTKTKNEEEQQTNKQKPGIKKRKPIDLGDMDFEDGEDKMAVAAERLDTFYLPPDNRKPPPSNDNYPEGTVVTYDGKAVLDTSLINSAPMNDLNLVYHSGLTKTEHLVRNTPQFGPFKGEIPPPISDFVSPDSLPQLKSYRHQAPVTEYSNPIELPVPMRKSGTPISTRLTLLKSDPRAAARKRREVKVELQQRLDAKSNGQSNFKIGT